METKVKKGKKKKGGEVCCYRESQVSQSASKPNMQRIEYFPYVGFVAIKKWGQSK